MKEAFEKIRKRIEEITVDRNIHGSITGCNMGKCEDDDCLKCLQKKVFSIVSEVEAEYGNPKTNADSIRSMTENEENLFNNLMQHNSTRYGYELSRLEINTILQSFEELKKRREKEYVQQENVYGENNGQ